MKLQDQLNECYVLINNVSLWANKPEWRMVAVPHLKSVKIKWMPFPPFFAPNQLGAVWFKRKVYLTRLWESKPLAVKCAVLLHEEKHLVQMQTGKTGWFKYIFKKGNAEANEKEGYQAQNKFLQYYKLYTDQGGND